MRNRVGERRVYEPIVLSSSSLNVSKDQWIIEQRNITPARRLYFSQSVGFWITYLRMIAASR